MSKKPARTTEEPNHPSISTVDRFPDDTLLRNAGFIIAERPKVGPTIWMKAGMHYTHTEALQLLDKK